jgi:hypothetical protein
MINAAIRLVPEFSSKMDESSRYILFPRPIPNSCQLNLKGDMP